MHEFPALQQYTSNFSTYHLHYVYSRSLARNHHIPVNPNILPQKALDLKGTLS